MKYSTKTLFASVLTALALSAASVSYGNTVVLYAGPAYSGNNSNPYQNGQGGEFTAITSNGIPAGYNSLAKYTNANGLTGFETFCVEGGKNDVYFTPGVTYNYVTSDQIKGGPMGTLDLTVGVAYLYSQFATGQLSGYFSGNRYTNAGALQNAFWTLEGESSAPIAGWIQTLLVGQFGSIANATLSVIQNAYDYDVQVMNITNAAGASAQNQLIYTGRPVPDGGLTIVLLGISFLGLALFKRQFGSRA